MNHQSLSAFIHRFADSIRETVRHDHRRLCGVHDDEQAGPRLGTRAGGLKDVLLGPGQLYAALRERVTQAMLLVAAYEMLGSIVFKLAVG
jgi:hypothetical protein